MNFYDVDCTNISIDKDDVINDLEAALSTQKYVIFVDGKYETGRTGLKIRDNKIYVSVYCICDFNLDPDVLMWLPNQHGVTFLLDYGEYK